MAIRLIDGNELFGIIKLLDTDIVRNSKTASWLLDQVLHDIRQMPTLTPPNEWVSAKDRLPEAGALIVYANNYGNEALYGVLRVPGNERPNRYDYWMPLPAPPDRRPPEREEDT